MRVGGAAAYWAFVPNPLPPAIEWTSDLIEALSGADLALGKLAGVGSSLDKALANPRLLIRPFVRQEAVFSSRIEGTRASLSDLCAYEAAQLTLFELPPDVHEVYNYVRALDYGLERLHTLPLSLRLLRELHARLLEGVRGRHQTPGEFRRSQDWIGPPGSSISNAPFVPPPVRQMQPTLHAFEQFLHSRVDLPPLVCAGVAHYQFEAIHPFLDGNGRIGRLLVILLLSAWGLLPHPLLHLSAYFEANRQRYYDLLLAVSQRGAWEAWLAFFLRGITVQAQDAILRVQRLRELREGYRQRFRSRRAAERLLQAVDLLFANPVFTVRHMSRALNVSFAAAQRYVQDFEAAGLVREITGRARNRVYAAEELLRAVEEPVSPTANARPTTSR